MASRLPLLGELRASRGARAARPATLALSGDVCVVGYEDGAVAAWRARDVVSAARDRTRADVTSASSSPVWVVDALNGSNGDRCPVDAMAILPACLAHPAGAVAVAHGGVQVDVTGVGGYDPRPARIAILDLDTGAETRALTLPMAWPDGGICPVARLMPADDEGGLVAVSAARVYRVGEGRDGFQGSTATLGIWSGGSPVPIAVAQAGPLHAPAHGPDPGEARRLNPGAAPPAGGTRARSHAAPILAPFAGLHVRREIEDGSGNENVVVRAAHVVVCPPGEAHGAPGEAPASRTANNTHAETEAEKSGTSLQICHLEWHLSRPKLPEGTPLRPRRVVETPSFRMGGDATLLSAAASDPSDPHGFGVSAATEGGGAPAVAGWAWGCAAAWTGCVPKAGVWRFGTRDEPDGFAEQPSAATALERCVAGVGRRCVSLVPAPEVGRLFAATRDDLRGIPGSERDHGRRLRLFVTRAGEATEEEEGARRGAQAETGTGTDPDAPSVRESPRTERPEGEGPVVPSLDDDTCPICLEVPGAGGDEELYRYDLRTNPFANEERLKNVVAAKCCGAPFCRSCLVEYLPKFPKGTGCPYCRDVDLFEATVPGARWGGAKHRESGAPWREISLELETLPWSFRLSGPARVAETEAGPAVETSAPSESAVSTLPEDFLRAPSASRGERDVDVGIDDGFLRPPSASSGPRRGASSREENAPDPHAMPMADGKPVFGRAGLSEDFFRTDKYGADLPPESISADFLRGMAPTDLVVSPAVGGPGGSGDARDVSSRAESDDLFVPLREASFVGFASGPRGEDDTLIRRDRESFAVDETAGVLAVLTERGVALLDASEETLRRLFVEEA